MQVNGAPFSEAQPGRATAAGERAATVGPTTAAARRRPPTAGGRRPTCPSASYTLYVYLLIRPNLTLISVTCVRSKRL